jgi:Transglutaminase-like superfamily
MDWWKSAINRWGKWKRLSGYERSLLSQSLLLLPLSAIALHYLGFRRLYAACARFGGTFVSDVPDSLSLAFQTAQMVHLANRKGIWRANCLQQSLVLWWLLQRQGINCDLRIGVRKASGKFEAHAWVEYQGIVLNDTQNIHEEFAPFSQAIVAMKVEVR